VGEGREVEENGGEEREGKETDGCPLTVKQSNNAVTFGSGKRTHSGLGVIECQDTGYLYSNID
jgi:hypothetical protein